MDSTTWYQMIATRTVRSAKKNRAMTRSIQTEETDPTDEQNLTFSSVQHRSEIMSSMFGIDPKSIQGHDLAKSIVGKTPEDVCAKIPEIFRILHIESVVRSDLAAKFF